MLFVLQANNEMNLCAKVKQLVSFYMSSVILKVIRIAMIYVGSCKMGHENLCLYVL